jgi:hypothetical protein
MAQNVPTLLETSGQSDEQGHEPLSSFSPTRA